jgi:predicted nuclease of predicted toxin-antitoxin system
MTLLVDQCVPRKFLKLLIVWGYTASLVQDHISHNSDDSSVLALAQNLDAVLVTIDMDFSNILNYPPQNYQGIIVIRYQAEDEEEVSKALKEVLETHYRDSLRKTLIIITRDRYRVRREES